MAKLYNLARVFTATVGTGTATLGAAVQGYLTFALAGVADGQTVWYAIKDGANSEIGYGVYTAAGTTLTRNVRKSTNSDSAISLTGNAEIFITPPEAAFSFWQRQTKSANYTVVAGDNGTLIDATSGTFTLSLTAAATLGDSFWFVFKNSGTGEVTYDPSGAETIDVLATFKAYTGEVRLVMCNGTSWTTTLLAPGTATFLASGTPWVKPGTGTWALLEAWGGGASGGKGAANAPEGGGGGGGYNSVWVPLSFLGTTETITIGAGGAAQTVASTIGNAGGNTTIGSWLTAFGGGGGGTNATGGSGGGGGGTAGAGVGGGTGAGSGGGGGVDESGASGGGGASSAGGISRYGGGGGGAGDPAAAFAGGASFWGGGGGGGGKDTAGPGGAGGASIYGGGGGGGAADSGSGGAGGTSKFGGAGSAGAIDTNASSAGTQPGGGSGGTEGGDSGIGGAGEVRITVF